MYAASIITPPANLPRTLYPDQRPIVYVVNDESARAVSRIDQHVADVNTGRHEPTPGRNGWTARRLTDAEIADIVALGLGASSQYRLVALPEEGTGIDLSKLEPIS